MTGSRVAAPLWRRIFSRVLTKRPDWKLDFDPPPDIVYRDVAGATGMLASEGEIEMGARVFRGVPFARGTEPTEISTGFQLDSEEENSD